MGASGTFDTSVFINCPLDNRYQTRLLLPIVFAVYDCGFVPHSALEIDDGGTVRYDKIVDLIRGCRLAIHDLSHVTLDSINHLPRFNMPFELGVFLGAKEYGGKRQASKCCLVFERRRYEIQKCLSDLAGQDMKSHGRSGKDAIGHIRNWLNSQSRNTIIPGSQQINSRYNNFMLQLPKVLRSLGVTRQELTFTNYCLLVEKWLKAEEIGLKFFKS